MPSDARPDLHFVFYISQRNDDGEGGLDWSVEIRNILARSRVRNAWNGLTGALLANRTHFIQVLQGPAEGLSEVFASISRDARHTILRQEEGILPERRFERWSMAYVSLDGQDIDVMGPGRDFVAGTSATRILSIMQHLLCSPCAD